VFRPFRPPHLSGSENGCRINNRQDDWDCRINNRTEIALYSGPDGAASQSTFCPRGLRPSDTQKAQFWAGLSRIPWYPQSVQRFDWISAARDHFVLNEAESAMTKQLLAITAGMFGNQRRETNQAALRLAASAGGVGEALSFFRPR
jgi:hypothetical protein